MKHLFFAATLLAIAVQPAASPLDQPTVGATEQIAAVGASPSSEQLSIQEMTSAVGGENLTGCWQYADLGGDDHAICCLDLWLFSICVDVNLSAVGRAVSDLL